MQAAVVIALLSTQVAAFQLPRYRTSLRTIRAAEPAPVTDVALTARAPEAPHVERCTGSVDVAVEVCALAGGRALRIARDVVSARTLAPQRLVCQPE